MLDWHTALSCFVITVGSLVYPKFVCDLRLCQVCILAHIADTLLILHNITR